MALKHKILFIEGGLVPDKPGFIDFDTLDKCKCSGTVCGSPTAHF